MSADPLRQSLSLPDYFAAGSPLAASLQGFAPRAGQARMAAAIATAIEQGRQLVVEAGTGTGKTLAYLLPALLSGRRVILSTGTKTLQDQLFLRDLPMVCGAIGRPARTVLLKGRANYLCLHRLEAARLEPGRHEHELRLLGRWAAATRSGDRAEVAAIAEDSDVWPRVTSTVENCLGTECEFYERCHVVTARQAALQADIVVVNHHLLMADLVLKEEGFGELLPGFDAVIVDEAHQVPDVAQAFFNTALSARNLTDLAEDLRSEALAALPRDQLPGALADGLVKAVRDLRLVFHDADGSVLWEDAPQAFESTLARLIEQLDDVIAWLDGADEGLTGLARCRERAAAAVETIETIRGADVTAGLRWIGLTRHGLVLNYTPVDVADNLQAMLAARGIAWVFTSATLTVAGSFAHFIARMGLADADTLLIESPFDYPHRGRLLVPEGLPDPAAPGYTRAMLATLMPLLHASRGRAFLLFTSHRALREAAAVLREQGDFPYPLLVQGEAPRSRLLEQFAALPDPVLLGTASFWEGVDMRGDNLVLVAIDRLPFASPGDPVLRARLDAIRQRGGNPFRDFQLPQAILGLKQGVGRLIRDFEDHGVVVICDPRIDGRSYGKQFLASLPPFTVTRDPAAAAEFLRDGPGPAA